MIHRLVTPMPNSHSGEKRPRSCERGYGVSKVVGIRSRVRKNGDEYSVIATFSAESIPKPDPLSSLENTEPG